MTVQSNRRFYFNHSVSAGSPADVASMNRAMGSSAQYFVAGDSSNTSRLRVNRVVLLVSPPAPGQLFASEIASGRIAAGDLPWLQLVYGLFVNPGPSAPFSPGGLYTLSRLVGGSAGMAINALGAFKSVQLYDLGGKLAINDVNETSRALYWLEYDLDPFYISTPGCLLMSLGGSSATGDFTHFNFMQAFFDAVSD